SLGAARHDGASIAQAHDGLLLVVVGFDAVFTDDEFDTGLLEHLARFLGGVVPALADDADDAHADNEHGTHATGLHAAVKGGAIQRNTVLGGLADGVLLGVDGAHAMLADGAVVVHDFLEEVADVVAVGKPGRGADIAGGDDSAVADDDGAATATI